MAEDSFCLLFLLLRKGRAGSTRISQQSADTLVGLFVGEQHLLNELHLWLARRRVLDDQLHRVCGVPEVDHMFEYSFRCLTAESLIGGVVFRIEHDLACYAVLEIVGIARRVFHCVDQDLPLLHATAITDPEAMSLEDAFGRPRRAATWKH